MNVAPPLQSQFDLNSSDEGPTDTNEHAEADTPDTDPDPEALTRASSGPVYSVFTPGMKRYIITIVMLTSFLSPMTAVSMTRNETHQS